MRKKKNNLEYLSFPNALIGNLLNLADSRLKRAGMTVVI